jgi:hypothetical protein
MGQRTGGVLVSDFGYPVLLILDCTMPNVLLVMPAPFRVRIYARPLSPVAQSHYFNGAAPFLSADMPHFLNNADDGHRGSMGPHR